MKFETRTIEGRKVLSANQVSLILKCSRQTVSSLARRGKIERVGRGAYGLVSVWRYAHESDNAT